jgi:hypothetical protein
MQVDTYIKKKEEQEYIATFLSLLMTMTRMKWKNGWSRHKTEELIVEPNVDINAVGEYP